MLQKVHRGKQGRRLAKKKKREQERLKREGKRKAKARERRIAHQLEVYESLRKRRGRTVFLRKALNAIMLECVSWIEYKRPGHDFLGRYSLHFEPWTKQGKVHQEKELPIVLCAMEAFAYATKITASGVLFCKGTKALLGRAIGAQTHLVELDLTDCLLEAAACEQILRCMHDGSCISLRMLRLAGNRIARGQYSGTDRAGHPVYEANTTAMRALSRLLGKMSRQNHGGLTRLDLANNWGRGRAIMYLAFPVHSKLVVLNLNGNIMGLKGALTLAESLRSCECVQELGLGHNDIGDDGLLALSDALGTLERLKLLDLSRNKLGPRGGFTLGNIIKSNASIQELFVSGNSCDAWGCRCIFDALQFHDTVACIDVSHMSIVAGSEPGERSLEAVSSLTDHMASSRVLREIKMAETHIAIMPKHAPVNPHLEARVAYQAVSMITDAATQSPAIRFIDLTGNNIGGALGLYPRGRHLVKRLLALGDAVPLPGYKQRTVAKVCRVMYERVRSGSELSKEQMKVEMGRLATSLDIILEFAADPRLVLIGDARLGEAELL